MIEKSHSKLRIGVVEDDFMVRQVIRDILEQYGAIVDIAENGEEAVQAFRVAWRKLQPYDLLCMNIMMPVMDVHEALVKIREVEKSLGRVGPEERYGPSRNSFSSCQHPLEGCKTRNEILAIQEWLYHAGGKITSWKQAPWNHRKYQPFPQYYNSLQ